MVESADGTKSYYDGYWSEGGFAPQGGVYPELATLFDRYIPNEALCLDVGCGGGGTGVWLKGHGRAYVGVDVSTTGVARARAQGLDARVIESASRLPFGDGSFDRVVCLEVLEHMFAPHEVAAEIRRVLKFDGIAVFSVPNIAYWRWRFDLLALGRWNPMGDDLSVAEPWRDPHIRFFTPTTLRAMLTKVGYTILHLSADNGGFLRDFPRFATRPRGGGVSRAYRFAERCFPQLLGWRIHAVAAPASQPRS